MKKSVIFKKIIETCEHGLLIFVFFLLIFSIFRMIFIAILHDYMSNSNLNDILIALWTGLRLSCQTSGILTLIILLASLISKNLSKIVSALIFVVISILYLASFPFYKQFHSNFNQIIFNAVNDDLYALLITFIEEFNLFPRLFFALVLSFIIYKIFQKLKFHIFNSILTIILTYFAINLTLFGGGLSWQTELNFENIGVTRDKFLNEAILDDFQAIYRGYVLQNRIISSAGLNFTNEEIKKLAAQHSHKSPISDNLEEYLKHSAKGEKISKPKHIFIIISESYANWPLLDKYSDLHIADGVKSIINSEDSDYCPTFLPNGGSTVSAVTGIVSGLADANLYLTTLPQSFNSPYLTATVPQMEKLGYLTNFYYAGPATWEKIEDFTTAQGFDNFYSKGDINAENITGNVWGVDDKFLYQFVENNFNLTVPSFNVILNTSNHSPYTISDEELEINRYKLTEDDDLNRKLAHFAYADRELTKFINHIKEKEPSSLFVIVGDHADRCNIDKQPSDYERFAVPFIITGQDIRHGMLATNSAGSHIDILPTIIELIAPKDFNYYTIGTSLTENDRGVNYALFITRNSIGNANNYPLKSESLANEINIETPNLSEIEDYINYVRGVSYWLAKFGSNLNAK